MWKHIFLKVKRKLLRQKHSSGCKPRGSTTRHKSDQGTDDIQCPWRPRRVLKLSKDSDNRILLNFIYLRPFEHAADDESIKPSKSFHNIRVDHPGIMRFLYQQKLLNDIKHYLGYNRARIYPDIDLDEIWDTTSIWTPDPNNPMMWPDSDAPVTSEKEENESNTETKKFPPYPRLDEIRTKHWRTLELPRGYELVDMDNSLATLDEEGELYEPPQINVNFDEYTDDDSEDEVTFGRDEAIVEHRLSQISSQSLEELYRLHDIEADDVTCGVNCSVCRRFFYERKQHYGLNDQKEKWETDNMAVTYEAGAILSNGLEDSDIDSVTNSSMEGPGFGGSYDEEDDEKNVHDDFWDN